MKEYFIFCLLSFLSSTRLSSMPAINETIHSAQVGEPSEATCVYSVVQSISRGHQ